MRISRTQLEVGPFKLALRLVIARLVFGCVGAALRRDLLEEGVDARGGLAGRGVEEGDDVLDAGLEGGTD